MIKGYVKYEKFAQETPVTQNSKEDLRNTIKYKVEQITELEVEVRRGVEASIKLKVLESGLKRNLLEYLFEGVK